MINKDWHEKNPMPKNPSLEQRIVWHVEHQKHCKCREMPASIKAEMAKRNEASK